MLLANLVPFRPDPLELATLGKIPGAKADPLQPNERLKLAFSTADVTLDGLRLEKLLEQFVNSDARSVLAEPLRYADIDPDKPFVVSLKVDFIAEDWLKGFGA
jgi:hypothetical protein